MKNLLATDLNKLVAKIPAELHMHWYTAERGVSHLSSILPVHSLQRASCSAAAADTHHRVGLPALSINANA